MFLLYFIHFWGLKKGLNKNVLSLSRFGLEDCFSKIEFLMSILRSLRRFSLKCLFILKFNLFFFELNVLECCNFYFEYFSERLKSRGGGKQNIDFCEH